MRSGKRQKQNDAVTEMIGRLDDIREATSRLQASFEAHLRQDEQFYLEVKEMAKSQDKIAERLSDYNNQLALHIAGVNELKKHTKILEENQRKFIEESNKRLAKIEKPFIWADLSMGLLKVAATLGTIGAAGYGVFKVLKDLGLF